LSFFLLVLDAAPVFEDEAEGVRCFSHKLPNVDSNAFALASRAVLLYQHGAMIDRRAFYDQRAALRPREANRFYQRLLHKHYTFLVPPGQSVLEVGCSLGDLLAAVKPARGVGVDFSSKMAELARQRHPQFEFHVADAAEFTSQEQFDSILLSDLVNDLPDVQAVLEKLRSVAHPRTRLVLNFFNNLWRPLLRAGEALGFKAPAPMPNWLSNADVRNLLHLAGWEVVKQDTRILWPVRTPLLDTLLNRWLAPLLPPFCLTVFIVARPKPQLGAQPHYKCSVVIPARNEAGNIEAAVQRTPEMGLGTEIIFIEGHSKDNTWDEIQRVAKKYPGRHIKTLKQQSKGKGGACREAFAAATGDILFILDADLTMPPEELPKFYEAARSGTAEFVNGVRLVYPMEDQAMQFLNMIANKCFGLTFSWLIGQQLKDTLCGTKVLFRSDYERIAANRAYFGDFDPFGDFDLIFGAAKLNLRLIDLPIRYRARTYGSTNIHRWSHGWLLLRMVLFAARRLKFL
jgi:SAM-dependent methyltransferase